MSGLSDEQAQEFIRNSQPSQTIAVPVAAALQLNEIITRHASVERELQNAVALVLATLGAPDGSQIRIEPDGSMVSVAPPTPTTE